MALRVFAIYGFIAIWEIASTPMVSHTNTWHGVWFSLLALPIGAYSLAGSNTPPSRFFLFGAAGSLLFLWRFLNMDRFSLWLEYQAPSTYVIVAGWVMFTIAMAFACWLAAKSRMDQARTGNGNDVSC